ncbi:MAG TPA: bifunctional alpha,alpha-trehalose-phosphate synthase (UDP-forming)/trehalose-phosphatase [Bacteroidetes bacterium]|nr:bifunctional alpha,alpha-trehalose-phosphate synthase (UDP-forming)/trehalose-phosphatase [Bacteroidota bacterium]
MKKLFIASLQLPVNVFFNDEGINIMQTEEVSIPGLQDFYSKYETTWVGHTGIENYECSEREKIQLDKKLKKFSYIPVYTESQDYEYFLHEFSRNTIWPLFHYFPQNASYNDKAWESYYVVNRLYAEKLASIMQEGDILWIHDYHLLLLPKMVREFNPGVSIGLFIHIPWPSYEVFRLLPWRTEILEGMLGSDLIGFHTYGYVRHFLSSIRRLLGFDTVFNRISIEERTLMVDAFPRGIHYEKFEKEVKLLKENGSSPENEMRRQLRFHLDKSNKKKIILSIDPLDYTKGMPQRIRAFELFLEEHPEYIKKVSLLLIALPSGETGPAYDNLKKQVDELVGRVNGNYGTISWVPIIYLNQYYSIEDLIGLYAYSNIALILPFREGMNMAAKEYIASRIDGTGVLIISELAGAAKELHEGIIVNPNNLGAVVTAIKQALEMPEEEQIRRNKVMIERLKRYTLERWAKEFISKLEGVKQIQASTLTRKIGENKRAEIITAYVNAKKRILFLDYDGTLSWFRKNPEDAGPDKELYAILESLTGDSKNTVTIISGRDKETLGRWFPDKWKLHFIAEHGVWLKQPDGEWHMMEQIDNEWKNSVLPLLEFFVDQTPQTFIEHKNFSLVWHYRKADPDLGVQRAWELKDELRHLTANLNLEIMDGDKVLEIKYSGINKGRAALRKIGDENYDFIFAVGDDWTDEYTFDSMPREAYTIKVGTKKTGADYYVKTVDDVRELLKRLVDNNQNNSGEKTHSKNNT